MRRVRSSMRMLQTQLAAMETQLDDLWNDFARLEEALE
jgi:hypothetical protein